MVCLYHWVLHNLLLFLPPPPPLSLFLSYTRRPTRHASSGVHRAIDKMCERRPRLSPHRFCSLHPLLPRVLNARLVVVVATHPTCPRCFEAGGSLRSSLTLDLAHRRHWWWVAVWLLMHISWTPYPFIHMSSKLDISVLTSPPPSQAPPSPSHHRYFFSLSTLWMAASQQGRQTRWRRPSSCGPWWQQQWKRVAWSGAKKLDNNGMDWILQNFSDTQLVSHFFLITNSGVRFLIMKICNGMYPINPRTNQRLNQGLKFPKFWTPLPTCNYIGTNFRIFSFLCELSKFIWIQ